MESLYPINNVAYHFMRVQSGITTEMVVYRNKTFNNSDELKKDIDDCKGIINFSEYSDMFITCCTLNSDYQQTTYLWKFDYVNNRNIYRLTLYDAMVCDEQKNTDEEDEDEEDEDEEDEEYEKEQLKSIINYVGQMNADMSNQLKYI